ncbi:hypothetical protein I4U23_003982 [Adineta vaga]|nr:hypothetical protein I4U23_003982 [Adineta vaga]
MARVHRFETKKLPLRNISRCGIFIIPCIILIWIYSRSTSVSFPTPLKITPELIASFRQKIKNSQYAEETETIWHQIIERYVPIPLDHSDGSHAIPLLASILLTNGSILELGCGHASTPMLHNVSITFQRYLLSVDSDKNWISPFSSKMSHASLHQYEHVTDWNTIGNDRQWSVVFVDNAPETRRIHDIIKYSYRSQVIILHDSESAGYMYEKAAPFFPYKYQYQYLKTYTDVWSTTNADLIAKIRHLSELTVQWQLLRAIEKKKNTI